MAADADFLSAPERLAADLRGSEVPDAIGLGYRRSRAALKRRLEETRAGTAAEDEPVPEWLERKLLMGRQHEGLAAEAFAGYVADNADGPLTVNETRVKKDYPRHGLTLAATPDLECARFTVELKCTDGALPDEPRPVHLAQCLAQMVAANKLAAALLYYQVHTAQFRVFWLLGSAMIKAELRGWLREFAERSAGELRMPPGERQYREQRLSAEMWHFTDNCTAPPWPPTTAVPTASPEETPASPTPAKCASALTTLEPGTTPR